MIYSDAAGYLPACGCDHRMPLLQLFLHPSAHRVFLGLLRYPASVAHILFFFVIWAQIQYDTDIYTSNVLYALFRFSLCCKPPCFLGNAVAKPFPFYSEVFFLYTIGSFSSPGITGGFFTLKRPIKIPSARLKDQREQKSFSVYEKRSALIGSIFAALLAG